MPQQLAFRQRRRPFEQRLKTRNPFWTISGGFVNDVAVNIRLLLQLHFDDRLVGVTRSGQPETTHLPRMNASNHLRRAVSSSMGEKRGFVSAIIAKERLRCLLRLLVECGWDIALMTPPVRVGRFDVGANQPVGHL